MVLADHLVIIQLCFLDNDGYLLRYKSRLNCDPYLAFSKGVQIDVVISTKDITLDQLIDESFDLTAC